MAVHSEIRVQRESTRFAIDFRPIAGTRKAMIAVAGGLAGGIGMALPLVVYDWANVGHSVWVPETQFGVITRRPCTRGSVLRGRLGVGHGQGR
jgi:hypothetical protein